LMGVRKEYDVGILMSGDTDLKPALEEVATLTDTEGTRAEVAAWSAPNRPRRRLAIQSRNLYCHWIEADTYGRIADRTNYAH
jgi:hypothetical protein